MPDYVAFPTRVLFDLGWRRGYTREDQALPLRGSSPLVPRAASPPGRNSGACTERNSQKIIGTFCFHYFNMRDNATFKT